MSAKKHRETEPDVGVALPVVPMLDLSFQILFFFIITFNPGKAEGKMTLNLPASGQAKAKDQASVDLRATSDQDLEVPADFVVVVRSYDDSFSLSLRNSEKVDEVGTVRGLAGMTGSKERQAEIDKLTDKLKAILKARKEEKKDDKADNVKIEANVKTKFGVLVNVMDACIGAGYAQVGFAPPPDLNQQ